MTRRAPWPLLMVSKGVEKIANAETFRDEKIRFAFDSEQRAEYGYTVDDIAEAAGLSRQRIYQIVGEAERDQ